MKKCKHGRERWDTITVEDYERLHGEQAWLDERVPTEIVSARCTACNRQIVLGRADEDAEARAAEIADALDPWLTGFTKGWKTYGKGTRVSVDEFRGIVGYICEASFDPVNDGEAAGWLAHHVYEELSGYGPVLALLDEPRDQERATILAYPLFRAEAQELARRLHELQDHFDAVEHELVMIRDGLEKPAPSAEEIGPHEKSGDNADCDRCGEGSQHYLHTDRDTSHDEVAAAGGLPGVAADLGSEDTCPGFAERDLDQSTDPR